MKKTIFIPFLLFFLLFNTSQAAEIFIPYIIFHNLFPSFNTQVIRRRIQEVINGFEINPPLPPEKINVDNSHSISKEKTERKSFNQTIDCFYQISGIPSPKGASFTRDGNEIWFTSLMNKSAGVIIIDAVSGVRKDNIALPGGGAVEIIFNKEGDKAYISQMETARIFEVEVATRKILRILATNSSWTKVMALSENEDILYASNWSGNNVSVIDLINGKLLTNIPTVQTPRGIYPTPDGKSLYIAGFAKGEIQKIDLSSKQGQIIKRTGGAMRHIVADENYLYISDMGVNKIYRVTKDNDQVELFATTEEKPNTIELSPDGKVLLVSNRGANNPESYHIPGPEWGTILFFDTSNGELLDVLIGGNQPTALAVYEDRFVYSDFLDATVTLCHLPAYQELISDPSSDDYKKHIIK